MALSAADLLTPRGVLEPPLLWPKVARSKVNEKLVEYLADAVRKTADMAAGDEKDEAQRLWAYYRAYAEVYNRLSITPASADVRDQGSRSYAADQRDRVKALMDEALEDFEEIAEPAEVEADNTFTILQSYRD